MVMIHIVVFLFLVAVNAWRDAARSVRSIVYGLWSAELMELCRPKCQTVLLRAPHSNAYSYTHWIYFISCQLLESHEDYISFWQSYIIVPITRIDGRSNKKRSSARSLDLSSIQMHRILPRVFLLHPRTFLPFSLFVLLPLQPQDLLPSSFFIS